MGGDIHIGGANFWLARLLGCDTTGFGSLEIHLGEIARLPHTNLIGKPRRRSLGAVTGFRDPLGVIVIGGRRPTRAAGRVFRAKKSPAWERGHKG